jgi:hypothetical protein
LRASFFGLKNQVRQVCRSTNTCTPILQSYHS